MAQRGAGRQRPPSSRHSTLAASVPTVSTARDRIDSPASLSPHNAASPSTSHDNAKGEPSLPKRAQRERGPNWSPEEMLLLIQAKRDQYLEELEAADPKHLMNSDSSKWQRVAADLQVAGYSSFPHDFQACRTKWNQIYPDYKKIVDFFGSTSRDVPEFWLMSAAAKKAENLLRQFPRSFFDAIHKWNGSRPVIHPPHTRDLLSPMDSNFRAPTPAPREDQRDGHDSDGDPYDALPLPTEEAAHTTVGGCGACPPRSTAEAPSLTKQRCPSAGGETSRRLPCIPPGATIHNVSSSATASSTDLRRMGSSGVRCKNIGGHTVIAEATKATGVVMASQMQGIADASLAVERSKMEVQVRLFKDQMTYQRKRDHRSHISATSPHENERLSTVKQGELVSCLAQLTEVLARNFSSGSSHHVRSEGNCERHPPALSNPLVPSHAQAVSTSPALQQTRRCDAPSDDTQQAPAPPDSSMQ